MNWRVTIRKDAQEDIREAREWYEEQRQGLGDEFLTEMIDALSRIEEAPERYPHYYKGFRRILLDRFPFKIFYRVQGDAVIVFRILHGSRDHTQFLR